MFVKYYPYLDRKKLPRRWFGSVFQPTVISRSADLQHVAHFFDFVLFLICKHKKVSFTTLYFFRSFAKKTECILQNVICFSKPGIFALKFTVSASKLFLAHFHHFFRPVSYTHLTLPTIA